jgi:hypothetical protein
MHESWKPFLKAEFEKPYFKELSEFLHSEYETKTIFPRKELVFRAFATDLNEVKVEAYPRPLTTVELLLESLNGSTEVFAGTPFEGVETAFRNWKENQSGKAYARIPYEITIK